MKVLGIITRTSKNDLFVLEGNSSRYLVKENLPSHLTNRPIIVYGTLNLKVDQATNKIIQFLNPQVIYSTDGKELWRAPKKETTDSPDSSPTESSEEDFF